MGHINLLKDENKLKIYPTKRMKFGLVVVNIPKSSRKQIQVTCSCKWNAYILVDFY
jgi:hypothetical protein